MKISFDIDDTLISGTFESEPLVFPLNILAEERIRKGTRELFKNLRNQNHSIGVYTTSGRGATYLHWLFFLHGLKIDFVVNQQKHVTAQKIHQVNSSKYPSHFGIDIHIDDSEGVALEGERFGFKTIIVKPTSENWIQEILSRI